MAVKPIIMLAGLYVGIEVISVGTYYAVLKGVEKVNNIKVDDSKRADLKHHRKAVKKQYKEKGHRVFDAQFEIVEAA